MSDSNWRRSYTIGLIVTAITVSLFAGWLWGSTEQAQFVIEQDAAKAADTYADPRNIAVEGKCLALTPSRRTDCITNEREASYEGQRKERDLEAQRVMAVWTRTIGIATIAGMAFGVFGLSLIFVTFRETRRAADAGLQANQIAQDANRPWLTLELKHGFMSSCFDDDEILFFADATIKNIGKLPALSVSVDAISVDYAGDEIYPKDTFKICEEMATVPSKDKGFIILPGSTQTEQVIFSAPLDNYGVGQAARVDVLVIADYLLTSGEVAQTSARFVFFQGEERGPVLRVEDGEKGAPVSSECMGYIRVT